MNIPTFLRNGQKQAKIKPVKHFLCIPEIRQGGEYSLITWDHGQIPNNNFAALFITEGR